MNMKALLLSILIPASLLIGAEASQTSSAVKIPADAVKVDDLTSRKTDAQGRTWTYRKTPFGIVKYEEKAQPGATAQTPFGKVKAEDVTPEKPAEGMIAITKVREEGDTLYFERPGPFGLFRWQRKKTELTSDEKIVWERFQASTQKSADAQKARE